MAQERFCVRHTPLAGSDVVVFREINGSLVQIGDPIDTSVGGGILDVSVAPINDQEKRRHRNLVVKFLGAVYCYAGNAVYKLNRGTGVWSAVHIITGQSNYYHHTGLYVAPGPSGAPRLFACFFQDAQDRWYGLYSDDGSSWTEVQGPVGSATGSGSTNTANTPYSEVMFNGSLFWCWNLRSASDMFVGFDPISLGFTYLSPFATSGTGLGAFGADLVNYKDNLFLFTCKATGTIQPELFELVGGTFTNQVTLPTPFSVAAGDAVADWQWGTASPPERHGMVLVCEYDPTIVDALIMVMYYDGTQSGAANRGGRAAIYDPDGVVSTQHITNTFIPVAWRFPSAPAIPGIEDEIHLEFVVDNVEVPGTLSAQLRFVLSQSGAVEVYPVVDTGSVLVSDGSGANYRDFAWSADKDGGGSRVWSDRPTEYDIVADSKPPVAVTGGQRRFFKLYSDPVDAATTHQLVAYFSDDGEGPRTQVNPIAVGKDSGPGPTPTLGGSTVQGLEADNGASEYYLDFPGPAQGVPNGEQHKLMMVLVV